VVVGGTVVVDATTGAGVVALLDAAVDEHAVTASNKRDSDATRFTHKNVSLNSTTQK
jgi:predicted RNA methylase